MIIRRYGAPAGFLEVPAELFRRAHSVWRVPAAYLESTRSASESTRSVFWRHSQCLEGIRSEFDTPASQKVVQADFREYISKEETEDFFFGQHLIGEVTRGPSFLLDSWGRGDGSISRPQQWSEEEEVSSCMMRRVESSTEKADNAAAVP